MYYKSFGAKTEPRNIARPYTSLNCEARAFIPGLDFYYGGRKVTDVKNELPIAVHHASGGDARVRCGGTAIALDGISSGSFQVTSGTRYRLYTSLRSTSGMVPVISYSNPATLQNAARLCFDLNEIADDVAEGTTVYFALLDGETFLPANGGALDYLYVSFYK